MKHPHSRTVPGVRLAALMLVWTAPILLAQSPPLPPGIADFAGRIAHNHWHLFGAEHRAEWDRLNRALREAERQLQQPGEEAAQREAAARGQRAATAILERVKASPDTLRVDLSAARPEFVPVGPVALPGPTGALLLEVSNGPGDVRFATGWGDLAEPRGESSRVVLPVGDRGLTYAVVGLENVPFGRTTMVMELQREGQPGWSVALEVVTPEPGRLAVRVLSDDTNEPTPAMVRLMWRTDGLPRRPSNGIEFAPQFDRQGSASGARAANLPGLANTHFWCVPGPFDMTVAPGPWQIGIRRGVEHEILFDDVTVNSGETVERTYRPRRWVKMRDRGWWSGDDHVHCRILSEDDARNLMAWVKAEDVHLANVVKMGDIYRTFFEQRGFGPAHRVIDGDTVLVPGQECPRTHDQIGHTLAMNITEMVRDTDQYYLYDRVFDAVHAQGGLTGYAHIHSGLFQVHRDMSLNVPRGKVDFGEILQFNHLGTDLYYAFLNLGCKLTASAGSDVPWGGTVGEVRVYAFLGDEPFSADAWFAAFGRGRTFTTSGPMIEFHVDDALPGDEIVVNDNRELRVRARAWGEPGRMTPITLEVVRHGDVVRTAQSNVPAQPEVSLDFTLPAGHGFWVAARARSGDGTSAHTTPVYVVRDGFRFWKLPELEMLLAERAESLRQIEQIVAEARELEAQGKLTTDRYRQQLAFQGDALLERVRLARGIYDDLRTTAAREREQRLGNR